mmetsp:Transcript_73075/g.174096  ORF Transcript_73075/g.174096 Transcript_73075/m.174096 type:complete len:1082 (+) Transcript_73075:101-3346(+)
MATIQVAMRCRPFSVEDNLGVELVQNSMDPPTGEVSLLHNKMGDRARFAFSYSWWSAFKYENKIKAEDKAAADAMKLMTQPDVYEAVGRRIKSDLMAGNAVVMFAYGLSGSGKTFTVFGPDAPDSPDAWYKHDTPHPLWGILPNLAYEIFQEKKEDWKISMKYFQNVVDIVRDLMSPQASEKHYKQGMKKDDDGFTFMEWCQSKVLHSWKDFRQAFMSANARKAISPTQFNHQSTRGHCIMTLEVEKPMEDDPSRKQRGRLYVCDLAGTEPAGDIYYADYQVVDDGSGYKDYICKGPHPDQAKTKELQDQGKKINLSLSEMAQFFMKMAEAVLQGKLKPGVSIPGCNSFFLCKFLKDTLLQAKTYLFCAIRPEVQFHKYTFATLNFAKNASVIKVTPKKATTNATEAERKLMAELESLKAAMEDLQNQKKQLEAAGTAVSEEEKQKEVEAAVAAKVAEMQKLQEKSVQEGKGQKSDQELRDQYARHGMKLARLESDTTSPYFSNIDMDRFRNGTFMFVLSKPEMSFGPKGDFRPQSMAVLPDHCVVTCKGDNIAVKAGKGPTYVNGAVIESGKERKLKAFDRLAVGSELLLLRIPGKEPPETELPTPETAVQEYQSALVATAAPQSLPMSPSKGSLKEDGKGEKKKVGLSEAAEQRIDQQAAELQPKMIQAENLCAIIDPSVPLVFELTVVHTELGTADADGEDIDLRVNVTSASTNQSIVLSATEFNTVFNLLNDELGHMRDAVTYGGEYTIITENRPVVRFFDHMIHQGTCLVFVEFLQYNLDTDPDERHFKIFNIATNATAGIEVGQLEVIWTPLAGPSDDGSGTVEEIDDPQELLGKPWTYRLDIKKAINMPINVNETYVEYDFMGERFITEVQEYPKGTREPDYAYSFVHHVPKVTEEFLSFLAEPFDLKIFVTPYVFTPPTGICSKDAGVADRIAAEFSFAATANGLKRTTTTRQSDMNRSDDSAELRKELAKAKMDKRLLMMKNVARSLTQAGLGEASEARSSSKGTQGTQDDVSSVKKKLAEAQAKAAQLEEELQAVRKEAADLKAEKERFVQSDEGKAFIKNHGKSVACCVQ